MTESYRPPVPLQTGEQQAPLTAQTHLSTTDVIRDQAPGVGHSSVEAGNLAAAARGCAEGGS
jgi:hypothetical protein